jgi:hypothetical protein
MRQRRMPYDLALQAVEKLFGVHHALHRSQVLQFNAPEPVGFAGLSARSGFTSALSRRPFVLQSRTWPRLATVRTTGVATHGDDLLIADR